MVDLGTDTWRRDQYGNEEDRIGVRLREHEQLWLQWVSLLHDHHAKLGTEESRIVLEIARRRWLDAKEALRHHLDHH